MTTRAFANDDISDVAPAIAILTAGVVTHFTGDIVESRVLIELIRAIEDRIILASFGVGAGVT